MKSDRTSCRCANANQMRLIKLAAQAIETASRVRIAFASACPDADIFRALARSLRPVPT